MVNIQRLDLTHVVELGHLNKQLIKDEGHSNPMSSQELSERMAQWLRNDYTCYGVLNSGRVVAYALYRDDASYFYLRQLFTNRACRKQGLASALLKYLQEQVFREKPVRLDVLAGNSQALEFYCRRGFSVYCHTLLKSD